jgi:sulfur-oxidizing protein SoxY
MQMQRRTALKHSATVAGLLLAAGHWPVARAQAATAFNRAAFDAKSLADVVKAVGGAAPQESKDITFGNTPDIAENGAVVPFFASTALPGVWRMMFLVEKNPNALAAVFDFGDGVETTVRVNIKMGQTSNVYAVAMTADNKVLFAQKEIKVTLGGCGG